MPNKPLTKPVHIVTILTTSRFLPTNSRKACLCYKCSIETHCWEVSRQVEGMCHFTSKPLESLSLFSECQDAENNPYWTWGGGGATGVIWALRAQSRKNESLGPLGPGGPKSPKRSRKRVKIDYFSTISTRSRLRFELFGPRGREVPGTHFRTFFRLWARRAQMTPVAGKRAPNTGPKKCTVSQVDWAGQEPALDAHHLWMPEKSSDPRIPQPRNS